jgi:phospholipid-translocating ATPase
VDECNKRANGSIVENPKKKRKEAIIYNLVSAMALCHNVTPTKNEEGAKEYQASSPDEVALVKYAECLGMKLLEKDQNIIKISDPCNNVREFVIDANFPFSSETKRMGILLHESNSTQYKFFLKGADSIMSQKVTANFQAQLIEACNNLASEGLRTLAFGMKDITEEEYHNWNKLYTNAKCGNLVGQEEEIRKVVDELEKNVTFMGVTGVEDKLQANVQITIESLKQAGISVWMLTGDKVETAKCIAISSGLKSSTDKFITLSEVPHDERQRKESLSQINDKNYVLVIDGNMLNYYLENDKHGFFETTQKLCGVVCCRCSPLQKSQIVREMKMFTKKRCAAIGDGGNDVSMILEADVGIGIVGKEGKQASLAADFSIIQFCHLKALLLWHGRISYLRTAALTNFIVHRGLIISVVQTIFSMIFYYCAISVYNSYLMLGYATYYTFLPVFCLVLDEDIGCSKAMNNPKLYEELQKWSFFSAKAKLVVLTKSLFQASIIMFCGILLFKNSFVNIVIITFSSLICIELLNIVTEVY